MLSSLNFADKLTKISPPNNDGGGVRDREREREAADHSVNGMAKGI